MKKITVVFVALVVAGFVSIQFFQPVKNSGTETSDHIFKEESLPDGIKMILKNACLDCHSNQTNYLWYHKIAPVSWMINNHITEGKSELNFSEWGQLDEFDKIGFLDEICKEAELKKMPLKPYVAMHKKARLSEEQVSALCTWAEKLGEELVNKSLGK